MFARRLRDCHAPCLAVFNPVALAVCHRHDVICDDCIVISISVTTPNCAKPSHISVCASLIRGHESFWCLIAVLVLGTQHVDVFPA